MKLLATRRSRHRRAMLSSPDFIPWSKAAYPDAIIWDAQDPDGATIATAYNDGLTGVYDGSISGATPAQPFEGNIPLSYRYNGIANFVNIHSAALNTAFDAVETTIILLATNSAGWVEAVSRHLLRMQADGTNLIICDKVPGANNAIRLGAILGGNSDLYSIPITTLGPFMLTLTLSAANDEIIGYLNETPQTPFTGIGTWVGNLDPTLTVLGNRDTAASSPWDGLISSFLILPNRALPQVEITEIYQRSGI